MVFMFLLSDTGSSERAVHTVRPPTNLPDITRHGTERNEITSGDVCEDDNTCERGQSPCNTFDESLHQKGSTNFTVQFDGYVTTSNLLLLLSALSALCADSVDSVDLNMFIL